MATSICSAHDRESSLCTDKDMGNFGPPKGVPIFGNHNHDSSKLTCRQQESDLFRASLYLDLARIAWIPCKTDLGF